MANEPKKIFGWQTSDGQIHESKTLADHHHSKQMQALYISELVKSVFKTSLTEPDENIVIEGITRYADEFGLACMGIDPTEKEKEKE